MTWYPIQTLTDVVSVLKTKEARDNGVDEAVFHANGIHSIEVAAVELRRRGYEVEVFEHGGGRRMRLLAVPSVGAKRRQKDQLTFLDPPEGPKPRGPYEEAA